MQWEILRYILYGYSIVSHGINILKLMILQFHGLGYKRFLNFELYEWREACQWLSSEDCTIFMKVLWKEKSCY